MYKVIFILEGESFPFQCNEEDSFSQICSNFCTKVGKDIKSLFFLNEGDILDLKKKFGDLIKKNKEIKNSKEAKILVFTIEENDTTQENVIPIKSTTNNQQNTENSKAMYKVIFVLQSKAIYVQCTEEDSFAQICAKYCNKIAKEMKDLRFVYNGVPLNLNQKFSEVIDEDIKNEKRIVVLVYAISD